MNYSIEKISSLIAHVPNFPKEGINFKDITPILQNGEAFRALTHYFAESIPESVTKLAAIESRGFIFAASIAHHLGLGIVLVRKPGKLPRETYEHSYGLEYGQDTLQIHRDALKSDDRVVIIDDVLATGGTAAAVEKLCEVSGATILGHRFLMEIESLNGRKKLNYPVSSFIRC